MTFIWNTPPATITANSTTVHLWRLSQSTPPSAASVWIDDFSLAEQARLARYPTASARQRFQLARGGLRSLLSHYLGQPAKNIALATNPYGKPHLVGHPLQFNLSHAGDWILYGIWLGEAVGVDIEQLDSLDYLESAKPIFAPHEYHYLQHHLSADVFFHIWTQKEALLKGIGTGLAHPQLSQISIQPDPHQPPEVITPPQLKNWSISPIPFEDKRYKAMVATPKPATLMGFEWL